MEKIERKNPDSPEKEETTKTEAKTVGSPKKEDVGQTEPIYRTKNGVPTEVKILLRTLYRLLSSHLGLLFLLLFYSFIGAAIFWAIEGPYETQMKSDIVTLRQEFIKSLWNHSQTGNDLQAFTKVIHEELAAYENTMKDASDHGLEDTEVKVWDFWGALFYAATIYTTIGYGHIAPATRAGQVVTIFYATVGIPLCLIVLTDLGKLFTRGIKFLWSFVRRYRRTGSCRKPSPVGPAVEDTDDATPREARALTPFEVDDEFNLPVAVALGVAIVYMFLGALLYCQWERWSYLEAFYFVFISMSTIGFGDVLPEHPRYFLVSSMYVLVGLALIAMVITVIMEALTENIEQAKEKLDEKLEDVVEALGISLEDIKDDELEEENKEEKKEEEKLTKKSETKHKE